MNTQEPTLEGFKRFMHEEMQVPPSAFPSEGTVSFAFDLAQDLALPDIRRLSLRVYVYAVYNLAASNLLQFAQDTPTSSPAGYWQTLRSTLGMNGFTPGVIASSSDNGTSQSWSIPETLKDLSVSDLQMLKNPYGQFYLSLAQQFGSLWAMV